MNIKAKIKEVYKKAGEFYGPLEYEDVWGQIPLLDEYVSKEALQKWFKKTGRGNIHKRAVVYGKVEFEMEQIGFVPFVGHHGIQKFWLNCDLKRGKDGIWRDKHEIFSIPDECVSEILDSWLEELKKTAIRKRGSVQVQLDQLNELLHE